MLMRAMTIMIKRSASHHPGRMDATRDTGLIADAHMEL
jgi:hypothetical protein